MKNRFKKIIFFMVTFLFVFNFLTINSAFAIVRPDEVNVMGSIEGAEKIKEFGGNILAIILTIGVVLSIIVLIIIGIKYMFGTIEDKAKYKVVLLPYTIGMFLLFAAIPITNVLFDLSGALVESSSTEGTNNGGGVPEKKPDASKRLYCTICNGDVIDKCKDKNNHANDAYEWRYKCNQCDFWSYNLNQQIGHSHFWENHAGEEEEDSDEPELVNVWYCKKCDKTRKECDDPESHYEEHEQVKKFRCKKCNSLFDTKKQYNEHTCVKD